MKYLKLLALSILVLLLFAPATVRAYSVEHGNSVYVANDQTVEGNLYAAGANITVNGHVTGDVICAGQAININGTVDGDVICAGQAVSVSGNVGGSVRTAGSNVDIRGKVARGLTAVGANINLPKDASIGWDALVAGANANLSGNIGRSLLGAGANFVLDGNIGSNAVLYVGNNKSRNMPELTVLDSAVVGGTLEYTSKTDASISSKAQIKGKVTHNLPQANGRDAQKGSGLFGIFLIALLSAMVVGYVLVKVWKQPMLEITDAMMVRFWPTVGWGAVWVIVTPMIAFLFLITVIGFRLTLVTIWSWLIVLMLSKVVAGIAIGRWLLNKIWIAKKDSMGWVVVSGIALSWIVFFIPVIGWLASVVALWWGAGAILSYLKKNYDMSKAGAK